MTSKLVSYACGDTLYSPFTDSERVFIIEHGYVIAYTHSYNGKRRIHLVYGPGAYFPVLATLNKTKQRATYEALTRVVVKEYPCAQFVNEIENNLDFSNKILRKTTAQLAIFADLVVNLQKTRVEDRLLRRLQLLAKSHGKTVSNGVRLAYILKHHHLADMIGVERESVSRALKALVAKNIIRYDEHKYLVICAV